MLININQVGKIINRHPSAVAHYIKRDILPKSCHRDSTKNTNYWCKDSVNDYMAKVLEYQNLSKRSGATAPKPKKLSVDAHQRPFETVGQIAANNAFNLCVNIT